MSDLPRAPDGHINNCALANGVPASECQMCTGICPDRARFASYPDDDRIGPDIQALIVRGNVTPDEIAKLRCNSWEWQALVPAMNDEAFVAHVEHGLANCSRSKRPFSTYDEFVIGLHAPELLKRFAAMKKELQKLHDHIADAASDIQQERIDVAKIREQIADSMVSWGLPTAAANAVRFGLAEPQRPLTADELSRAHEVANRYAVSKKNDGLCHCRFSPEAEADCARPLGHDGAHSVHADGSVDAAQERWFTEREAHRMNVPNPIDAITVEAHRRPKRGDDTAFRSERAQRMIAAEGADPEIWLVRVWPSMQLVETCTSEQEARERGVGGGYRIVGPYRLPSTGGIK